jgi:hypothetical protein
VQTYLVHDVVDYVDANYRTVSERGARAIGGLSTGGYCAVNLVLRHQDVFSGIVSHSGYDRPDHNVYTGDLFGSDRREERANTPGQYLPTIPLTQPLGVYIDVGMSDGPSRSESTELSKAFERRGVAVTFHDFADESHSWLVWRRNLYSSLPWVSSWFVSTGVSTPSEPGGTAVLAAPPAPGAPTARAASAASGPPPASGAAPGPEAAPTDSTLLDPPDPLHIAGPAEAATIERHLPPVMTPGHHRLRGRPRPSPLLSPLPGTGRTSAGHRPSHPSAGRVAAKT